MASENYTSNISSISEYFGISEKCAQYMYHRALRSKRNDDSHIAWTIQLQNALVRADKCLGMVWEKIIFGMEGEELTSHGITIDEMPNKVFRWSEDDVKDNTDDKWTTVTYKKPQKKNLKFKFTGIFT